MIDGTKILNLPVIIEEPEWEKENRICIVRKGICPISKHRAGFYTANPELFPTSKQLNLF